MPRNYRRVSGADVPENLKHRGCGTTVDEHRLICQRALGRPLPKGTVVHHVDGNGKNNEPSNLVLCENANYHHLLHRRERALKASGNPRWFRCSFCRTHDAPENLRIHIGGGNEHQPKAVYHAKCASRDALARYYAKRIAL